MPNIPMLTAAGLSIVAATYGLARYCFGLFLPEIRDAFNLSSQTIGLIAGSSYAGFIPELAKILASWVPPGHRTSTSMNFPDESQTPCAFKVYFIL